MIYKVQLTDEARLRPLSHLNASPVSPTKTVPVFRKDFQLLG